MSLTSKFLSRIQFREPLALLHIFTPVNNTNRNNAVSQQSFEYNDLTVNLSPNLNQKPEFGSLKFGSTFSDHVLEVEWTESEGWGKPCILPIHPLQIHPGAKVLQYAQAVFEGMKAFRHSDDKIALFRPDLNIERFLKSSQRACLPEFNCDELLKCIKKLVNIDNKWVPNRDLCSLYIRPNFIGTESSLGVASAKKALLYVVTCPVGPYFQDAIQSISLLADPKYVRAFPGGVGSYKMSSNYAPTLYIQKLAQKQGLDQVLWLFGEDHQITEAGAMNVFVVLKSKDGKPELITPPLDGTILPGVVRRSILDLARDLKEILVSERPITMSEIICAREEDRLLEIFLSGTALGICPVKLIRFKGKDIQIPTTERKDPLCSYFLKTISDIQYGRIKSQWSVYVDN